MEVIDFLSQVKHTETIKKGLCPFFMLKPCSIILIIAFSPDQSSAGWIPSYPLANEWIQVDFRNITAITGVTIQGQVSYHVTTFTVMYGNTGEDWQSLSNPQGEPLQV